MATKAVRAIEWAAARIPTLLVWVGLTALFAYGAMHHWKFGEPGEEEKGEAAAAPEEPGTGTFTPYYLERSFDVPVLVTHDPAHCKIGTEPLHLQSPDVAMRAGFTTARAECADMGATVAVYGDIQQDPTATARVSPRVSGLLHTLEKQLGDPVRKGELLALIESADVGKAKAAYLSAKAALESREQVRASLSSSVSPPRSIVEAEAALREARAALYSARQAIANLGLPVPTAEEESLPEGMFTRRLQLLGVPFGKRLELYARANAGEPLTANLLPIFSPLDGVVTRQYSVAGETIAALQPLYEVGDPTRVYIYLDVRQEDMTRVRTGQPVSFRVEGSEAPVQGRIDWVSPNVDEKTRTVHARARVPNPEGTLKSGAFGSGTIAIEPPRRVIVVPLAALHWEGCSHIVFIKKSLDEYLPRKVTLGIRSGKQIEVSAGLAEGDEVVVDGSHLLKNELLKARIGEAEE